MSVEWQETSHYVFNVELENDSLKLRIPEFSYMRQIGVIHCDPKQLKSYSKDVRAIINHVIS